VAHPAGGRPSGLLGNSTGNTVKPCTYPLRWANGIGLAGEYQERRLRGVLGIVPLREHPPARCQHHRPVPVDEFGKRLVVPLEAEAFDQ
jgi:hypothetical protein